MRELLRRDARPLAAMTAAVIALHVIGFGMLAVIASSNLHLADGKVFGIGLGITAYTLGMRHAYDVDHVAAIDNTTRTLVNTGKRPLTVGFWFSLGHSTVVFALCVGLAAGIKSLSSQVGDDNSTLQRITGILGTSVSGAFLIVIGLLNLVVLHRIIVSWRSMRAGTLDAADLDEHLANRGLITRLISRWLRAVRRPAQMYPIGFLFGLGFDTATEVSLLVLAGAAAVQLPWYAILCLPILFTAGMTLFDSLDGVAMNYTYAWAGQQPERRMFYNVVITALSVLVALLIGGIEIVGLLADKLNISSGPIGWIGRLDLNNVGYVVVALFLGTWALAFTAWHLRNRTAEPMKAGSAS